MAKLLLIVGVLGLALSLVEAIVVHQVSGKDACGLKSAELSHEVEPDRYRVSLKLTDLKAVDFEGQAEIQVKVLGNKRRLEDNLHANQILLNAAESIDIEDVWYEKTHIVAQMIKMKGSPVKVVGVCLNTDHQVLVVTLAEDLEPGSRGILGFRYRAKYGRVGLRRGSVALHASRPSLHLMFAGEQFARRVFPSFDDPSFPAKFSLEVTCPKALKPLSNEVSDVDDDKITEEGNKVNKFAQTRTIPTKDLVMSLYSD